MILEKLGCCENRQPFCVYVAGAGGKTSWIRYLAAGERKKGKRILILTSTHMYAPEAFGSVRGEEDCREAASVRLWEEEIGRRLRTEGIVIAGKRCGEGKIGWVGETVYERVKLWADVVLIEADGSRHLPVKVPGKKEPVIFPDADLIFVTEGMNAVGKPLREVCHRLESAKRILGCGEEDLVTADMVRRMYREGYEPALRAAHPGVPVLPVWVYQEEAANPWEWERDRSGAVTGILWKHD